MRRRGPWLALGVGALPVVAFFVACTFPDVTFGPGADGGDVPGSETGAPEDGGGGGADALPDGNLGDVATRGDSQVVEDVSVCETRPLCDCDLDGYLSSLCDAGLVEAGMLDAGKAFDDCDDLDGFRHPGQLLSAEVPDAAHGGDWNCNGDIEKGFAETSGCSGTGLTGCNGTGFHQTVSCGAVGEYYNCRANGLGCARELVDTRPQYCK